MRVELLRRAAGLMRERAADLVWNADLIPGDSLHLWIAERDPEDPTGQTPRQSLVRGAESPWAEHIASWHPLVALAVAETVAENDFVLVRDDVETCTSIGSDALALARAYLGEDK